jgi:hypothetical protein
MSIAVRISGTPPSSLDCREIPTHTALNSANIAANSLISDHKPDRREGSGEYDRWLDRGFFSQGLQSTPVGQDCDKRTAGDDFAECVAKGA